MSPTSDERDVRSLGEDIQRMIIGGYTSFIEGIHLQDEDLAWDLADKYADKLRDNVRIVFAELAGEASKALMKPPAKRRRRTKKAKAAPTQSTVDDSRSIGVEELPENPDSLVANVTSEDDVALRLEAAMRSNVVTRRGDSPSDSSRWDQNNPTLKRNVDK
jgi:hypothetical protein